MPGVSSKLTTATLVLLIVSLVALSTVSQAQLRHPLDLRDPVEALLDSPFIYPLAYEDYACLAESLYSTLLSSPYAEIFLEELPSLPSKDKRDLIAMIDASMILSKIPATYNPAAEDLLSEAKDSISRSVLSLLAAGFDPEKKYASTEIVVGGSCQGITIRGPASHVVITLVNSVVAGDTVVLVPVSSKVKISGAIPSSEGAGPSVNPALNPEFEDKIRQELFPEDPYPYTPRDVEGVSEEVIEDGEAGEASGDDSAGIVDLRDILSELARRLGDASSEGSAGSIPGGAEIGGGSEASIAGRIAGSIGITFQDIQKLSEILNVDFPMGYTGGGEPGSVVVPSSPFTLGREGLAFTIAGLALFTLVSATVFYGPSLARELKFLSRRLVRRQYPSEIEECYWKAVRELSKIVVKEEWETPREHLRKVAERLGSPSEAIVAYSSIVNLYERVRYGGMDASKEDVLVCWSNLGVIKSDSR